MRALEDYRAAQPQSASARFVLAYHYFTQGHTEAAVEELKEVVKLQPGDQLSTQLIASSPVTRRKVPQMSPRAESGTVCPRGSGVRYAGQPCGSLEGQPGPAPRSS